jgi:hypothetical protein
VNAKIGHGGEYLRDVRKQVIKIGQLLQNLGECSAKGSIQLVLNNNKKPLYEFHKN